MLRAVGTVFWKTTMATARGNWIGRNMDDAIVVYRAVFPFVVGTVVFGAMCGFFLLDAMEIIPTRLTSGWPWITRAIIPVFAAVATIYTARPLCFINQPVLVIDKDGVTIARRNAPWRTTRLDRSQITHVRSWWYPDAVPAFVIFVVRQIETHQSSSGVWDRIRVEKLWPDGFDHRGPDWASVETAELVFEASNLTMNAREIARAIEHAFEL
jgi:hypothetical protein